MAMIACTRRPPATVPGQPPEKGCSPPLAAVPTATATAVVAGSDKSWQRAVGGGAGCYSRRRRAARCTPRRREATADAPAPSPSPPPPAAATSSRPLPPMVSILTVLVDAIGCLAAVAPSTAAPRRPAATASAASSRPQPPPLPAAACSWQPPPPAANSDPEHCSLQRAAPRRPAAAPVASCLSALPPSPAPVGTRPPIVGGGTRRPSRSAALAAPRAVASIADAVA